MIFLCILLCVILAVMYFYLRSEPSPLFGIYKQPGKYYYIKFLLLQIMFRLSTLQNRYSKKMKLNHPQRRLKFQRTDMDMAQPLSKDPMAFDAVSFVATNKDGYSFVAMIERRQHGVVNGFCYLFMPGIGLLCSQKLPDTILFGGKNNEFGAEGITFKPLQAMHKWKVMYDGKMWLASEPSKEYHLHFIADWVSTSKYFDFNSNQHPASVAHAIAMETWNNKYFSNLRFEYQTHYNQLGTIQAAITLNQKSVINIGMEAFKDHSYGYRRDWNLLHRYVLHMLFLQDGTTAVIGVTCKPCVASAIQTGYVQTKAKIMYPLEWCDLQLYQLGEGGTPPMDYGFQFKAGHTVYTVEVNVLHQAVHYIGWNWEARMVECFVQYKVNGIPGQGISEFHYHNTKGRPLTYSSQDPHWFQALKY